MRSAGSRVWLASGLLLSMFVSLPAAQESCHSAPSELLVTAQCGEIGNLHMLGPYWLSAQPQAGDFALLGRAGIKTVVNLRAEDESKEFDERALVEQAGLEYIQHGFGSASSMSDDVIAKLRAVLRDPSKQPLLLHCASGNRVGAIWLIHRVLDAGLDYRAAVAEAEVVGLAKPEFEAAARSYIERESKAAGEN